MACAAVDGVIAWALPAFVIAVVQGRKPDRSVLLLVYTAVFGAVMFLVVWPLLRGLVDRYRAADFVVEPADTLAVRWNARCWRRARRQTQ